jgi:hypothetical protein
VKHIFLGAALVLCGTTSGAQQFIAPSQQSILAGSDLSHGSDGAQLLWVRNESTIPIVVYGITLSSCLNIKQFCGGERMTIQVPPGEQRTVFRVTPDAPDRASDFRWRFVYHADSTDAKAMALLLANSPGANVPPPPPPQPQPQPQPTLIARPMMNDTTPLRRRDPVDTMPAPTFRLKVAYGSILGSTMTGAPIQLTGPCINPAELTTYEHNAKITKTPWRPAVFTEAMTRLLLPTELKDSTLSSKEVLVKFVVDTSGAAIPGSVSVLESPHGLVSESACKAAISAHASSPAKDKAGKLIQTWVQIPMRVGY